MKANEIRRQFLDFFASKGHKIVPSAPMVIKNDPTLMFINAGMNPFKDIFLGNREAQDRRVADTQKCLRVSGKHNDLEEVGVDTYHHTMFEMLGNWSFGDYFKEEAIQWAWELLTEIYHLPKDRLYVTIFEGDKEENLAKDEESALIWEKYIAKDRILLGNKKDNFWEMGDIGPCGPCTEIHFDSRSDDERALIDGKTLVNQDNPHVIEIWNNVFMEFNRKADKALEYLPAKHVDTGMGFERLVRVIQNKTSNYDTDVFTPLIEVVAYLSKKKYTFSDSKQDVSFRVIVDHIRAIAFSIADGQIPSNTKAGYVIRRILRRAIRYGYTYLGFEQPFMYQLVSHLGTQMQDTFPEILAQKEYIENVIREEESSFFKTLSVGIKLYQERKNKSINSVISGEDAFELYDTYGFPIDLTRLMAMEDGLSIDEEGFQQRLQIQKDNSKAATKIEAGDWTIVSPSQNDSQFVGYTDVETVAHITKYRLVKTKNDTLYQIVLDRTPFYAESGGQVGDTGTLQSKMGLIEIINTLKENDTIVHFAKSIPEDVSGEFKAMINVQKRKNTSKNHTATHLMQSALRQVLGDHVQQRGSLVNEQILRFDFSHFAKMTDDEIERVEQIVNQKIAEEIQGLIESGVPLEEAKKRGVTALFGEKYGEYVRVVTFDPKFSMELCGGTHVKNTSELGFFKILSESSSAAGIRRIEATTGDNVLKYYQEKERTLGEIQTLLKHPQKLVSSVQSMMLENANLKKSMAQHEQYIIAAEADKLKDKSTGKKVVFEVLPDFGIEIVKNIANRLRQQMSEQLIVLTTLEDGKQKVVVAAGDSYLNGGHTNANQLVKDLSKQFKGGGGGQPTLSTFVGDPISDITRLSQFFEN